MTLIDQAVMKAFQRREQPSVKPTWSDAASVASRDSAPRSRVSPQLPRLSESKRELFLHAPETLLRGLHQPSHRAHVGAGPKSARAVRPTNELTDELTDRDADVADAPRGDSVDREPARPQASAAVEAVMNSLMSYELSIQGPRLEAWQIATETSVTPTPLSFEEIADAPPAPPRQPTALPPFKPAWETDAFRLTEMCRKIQLQMQDSLRKAAATLIDDCVADRPVINVTGCCRGEGRTTVSILLARALAKAGLRVILVDGDFANPDLAEHLGVAVDGGWNAGVNALDDVAECCVHSLAEEFSILSLDAIGPSDTQAAAAELPSLLQRLASHFDVIVVDSGTSSIEGVPWPQDLLGAHVVVRDRRQADEPLLEHVIARLLAAGESVIRVVENFA